MLCPKCGEIMVVSAIPDGEGIRVVALAYECPECGYYFDKDSEDP